MAIGRISFEVGLLTRRTFRRFLAREAFKHEARLKITYEEERGWLESDFHVKLEGTESDINYWVSEVKRIAETM